MRNKYFLFCALFTIVLFFSNSNLLEGRSDELSLLHSKEGGSVDKSGSKSGVDNRGENSFSNKYTTQMRSMMKRLMPASFNESPVVLHAMLYSTITATWTGAVSSDWNNTGNWMDGVVPSSMDIVLIPDVVNDPVIMNGTNATAQSVMVEAGASLTIATTGSLSLEGATGTPSGGMHNLGTVTNNGSLQIGMNISPGEYGLVNEGAFLNNESGVLNINRSAFIGLWNRSSESIIINIGTIICGGSASIGTGIYNEGAIQNNGGNIEIDRSSGAAIDNRSNSTINNLGKILIGQVAITSGTGIYNFGHIQNFSAGEIEIDRTNSGIFNTTENSIASSFINSGSIAIGQIASVNGPGIYNNTFSSTTLFENNTGAEIFVDRTNAGIQNSSNSTINNSGLIHIGNIGSFSSSGLGIYNTSTFNNESSGEIKIDKCPRTAMHHRTGTFTNGGKITAGITEVNTGFDPGVYLDGPFINMGDAEIHIDRYTRGALQVGFSGSLTNAGLIMIGKDVTGGNNGLYNDGTSVNQGTGEIHIDNMSNSSNTNGIYNGSNRSFTNAGKIFIGRTVSGGSTGFYDTGNTVNSGEIHIDNIIGGTSNRHGLRNTSGSFTNTGKILLGESGTIGEWGIWNGSTFNNNAGGEISIDRSNTAGLRNGSFGFGGTFTNIGKLTIGENSGVGNWGIWNDSPFINSGELSISNASVTALRHESTTFTNSGQIILGDQGSAGEWGLWSQASFTNESGGEVYIDETSNTGLLVFSNTFSNHGTITIGAGSSVGDQAIYLEGTLENNSCAELNIFAPFHNVNTFSNFGLLLSNTNLAHTNTGFTNEGIIAYPQGNPIPEVTNNEIIIAPTTNEDCQVISPAFELGASVEMAILGVYTDVEGTISAGSYDMMANSLTTLPVIQAGVYDLFVQVEDENGGCIRMVPWQLTTEDCCDVPLAICQNTTAVLAGSLASITAEDIDGGSTVDCGLASIEMSQTTFTCSDVGAPQTVTLTVTDTRGNIAICNATVTVIDDTQPTISCPGTQTLLLDENCEVTLPDYTDLAMSDDNCTVVSVTQIPTPGTELMDAGDLTVTLTVTDASDLTSSCSFTVEKIDNTPPSVVCFNQNVTFNGEVSIPLDSEDLADASDNCGIQSVALSPNSISSSQVGQTVPVQVTVTDLSNNSATCTSQITVGGLPSGWSQNANGVGCTDGNTIEYEPSSGGWIASSSNCFYSSPFNSDAAAFAQYTLCGNGSITAQVTGITGTSLGWAGVTMRETNEPGAKKAQLTTNMSNFSRREFRTTTNGAAFPQQFPSQNRRWLRIVRSGNQFVMYVSHNGATWSFAGAQNIQMNSCIEIGLVVSNYSSSSTVTATFANVSVTGGNHSLSDGGPVTLAYQDDETGLRDVKVYPNPTSGELNIALTGYEGRPVTLEVFNTMGQMLYINEVDEVQNADEIIDLSSAASGMYLIRISSDGLPAEMKRVMVAR